MSAVAICAPIFAASPAAAAAAAPSALPVPGAALPAPGAGSPDVCLSGVTDPGPLGPDGPYGAGGPYGPDGPLHGTPNPLGNVATCGGALAFLLRGGTVASFVDANLASVGR